MWPKYPRLASRGPRSRNRVSTNRGASGGAGRANGPARTRAPASTAPTTADTADVASTPRHGSEARLDTSCGSALPSVSAAMSTPSANPRPRSNHDVMSFIPTGYTPARAIPVTNRSTTAGPSESTATAMSPVAPAATRADSAMTR